jgi:hypothetical protein
MRDNVDLDQVIWTVEAFHAPGDCWLTLGVFSSLQLARMGYAATAEKDSDVAAWDYVIARPMILNQIDAGNLGGDVVLRDNTLPVKAFEPFPGDR